MEEYQFKITLLSRVTAENAVTKGDEEALSRLPEIPQPVLCIFLPVDSPRPDSGKTPGAKFRTRSDACSICVPQTPRAYRG